MHYFIGVDGGGTKTAFCLMDDTGNICATANGIGTSYRERGIDAVCDTLHSGIRSLLKHVNCVEANISGIVIGIPCFGESSANDTMLLMRLSAMFSPVPLRLVNDVEVGFAGSLALSPGIHLVSGTGSLAFGRNAQGETARCGGWDEFFSDEGSCYWLGQRALSLFSKEADGRLPRGPLYDLVRDHFSLNADYDIIGIVTNEYRSSRARIAALQMILLGAARQGDPFALNAYQDAAGELALLTSAIRSKIWKSTDPCSVSYSGGLFLAGEIILDPLSKKLAALNCVLMPPLFPPHHGAALLALQAFEPDLLKAIL
jgi:N-acetylglucosamine kinase-like BadF-type ATPase